MSLFVAKLLVPVRRRLDWSRPRLAYVPDYRYTIVRSLTEMFRRR